MEDERRRQRGQETTGIDDSATTGRGEQKADTRPRPVARQGGRLLTKLTKFS